MVTLYHFMRIWGIPDGSPFCVKLETYLRMAEIEYKADHTYDIRKAPKGKFPIIEHKGKIIADSSIIIDYLKDEFGDKLDSHLSEQQKAQSLAMQRLIEEHFYWVNFYLRWAPDEAWSHLKKDFFGHLPFPLKLFLPDIIRKDAIRNMKGHGINRHSYEEICKMGEDDLKAMATHLNDKTYFMGDQPSSIDAVAYGFLANILACPIKSPITESTKTYPNLVDYTERMTAQYFPDMK